MDQHHDGLCVECSRSVYEEFRHACVHESQRKNDVWLQEFEVHSNPRWDYSLDDATLTFSRDGEARLLCKIQVVGTSHGTSWEWSWGNASLPTACKQLMGAVHEFGEAKQWPQLTTLFLEHDQFTGWEYVSISNHLLGGMGAYRCGDDEDAVWVVILACSRVQ